MKTSYSHSLPPLRLIVSPSHSPSCPSPISFVLPPSSQMNACIFRSPVVQLSFMCRPSQWLCRVQLGSQRDERAKKNKQLVRPPTITWIATHLFCSQVKSSALFISKRSEPSPSEAFRSSNPGRLHRREKKRNGRSLGSEMLKREGV